MEHPAEQTLKTAMRTISRVVLPEDEVVEEEVELVGDVVAEPVACEELPAVPRTGVVLVGTG